MCYNGVPLTVYYHQYKSGNSMFIEQLYNFVHMSYPRHKCMTLDGELVRFCTVKRDLSVYVPSHELPIRLPNVTVQHFGDNVQIIFSSCRSQMFKAFGVSIK